MSSGTLKHYGILGMKWGVRRSDEQLGNSGESSVKSGRQGAATTSTSSDHSSKPTDIKKLDNAELQRLVQRMSLEKQYASLLGDRGTNPAIKVGKTILNEVVAKNAKEISNAYIRKAMGDYIIRPALDAFFSYLFKR